eukprot:2957763-Rhodomonas_salina.2
MSGADTADREQAKVAIMSKERRPLIAEAASSRNQISELRELCQRFSIGKLECQQRAMKERSTWKKKAGEVQKELADIQAESKLVIASFREEIRNGTASMKEKAIQLSKTQAKEREMSGVSEMQAKHMRKLISDNETLSIKTHEDSAAILKLHAEVKDLRLSLDLTQKERSHLDAENKGLRLRLEQAESWRSELCYLPTRCPVLILCMALSP